MKKSKLYYGLLGLLSCAFFLTSCGSAPPRDNTDAESPANDGAPAYNGAQVDEANKNAITNQMPDEYINQESYLPITENQAIATSKQSVSTFSLKVDTAAYSNIERYLQGGNFPPADAVRIEELLNYFSYDGVMDYDNNSPFGVSLEVGPSPFHPEKKLAFVRVKTPEIDLEQLPPSNLIFLVDTSGSMASYDKLPLLKEALHLLVDKLGPQDRVSIVTYAGSSSVLLDSASGKDKKTILSAINQLEAGGSTAGAEGINTAYELAEKNFLSEGNNRIILATDGDFNVGINDPNQLAELVSEKRESDIYLSILGFGTGNLREDIMETLSKNGNGNYSYIYTLDSAEKVLVEELASNLYVVATDVKAQIEFNPAYIRNYRLLGYENRLLANQDFANDAKDAGEIGAGTDVVFLYELEMTDTPASAEESLRYTPTTIPNQEETTLQEDSSVTNEIFQLRIRYKNPGESSSNLLTWNVEKDQIEETTSSDFLFAAAVAEFGENLRNSEQANQDITQLYDVVTENQGKDEGGYRKEFLLLLQQYQSLSGYGSEKRYQD